MATTSVRAGNVGAVISSPIKLTDTSLCLCFACSALDGGTVVRAVHNSGAVFTGVPRVALALTSFGVAVTIPGTLRIIWTDKKRTVFSCEAFVANTHTVKGGETGQLQKGGGNFDGVTARTVARTVTRTGQRKTAKRSTKSVATGAGLLETVPLSVIRASGIMLTRSATPWSLAETEVVGTSTVA